MATTETATDAAPRRHATCCQPQHSQILMCSGRTRGSHELASDGQPVTCSDCIELSRADWCPVLGTCRERRPKPEPEPEPPEPTGDRSKATLAGRTRTNLGSKRSHRPLS